MKIPDHWSRHDDDDGWSVVDTAANLSSATSRVTSSSVDDQSAGWHGWRVEGADAAVGTRDACEMTPFSNEGRPEVVNMMNDRINHDAAALSCTVAHRCSPGLNCTVHCIFRVFASFRDRNAQSRLPDPGRRPSGRCLYCIGDRGPCVAGTKGIFWTCTNRQGPCSSNTEHAFLAALKVMESGKRAPRSRA